MKLAPRRLGETQKSLRARQRLPALQPSNSRLPGRFNVDLPWNPAKLEQRIARAWRKNQPRSVAVVNLVTQGSIEHSILHLLGQKQALADGVLDGAGDVSALKMQSGRGAFIERMQAVMGEPSHRGPRMASAQDAFVGDLVERLGEKALLVEERRGADGRPHLLVVLDTDDEGLAAEAARAAEADAFTAEFVDAAAWRAMRRLAAAGLLQFAFEARELHRARGLPAESPVAASAGPREAEVMAEAPKDHWPKISSTNGLERLNGEVKRRTEVVGIFPNEDAVKRLVGAILLEQNDEWAVQRSRFMTLESLAALSDDPIVKLPAVAA